MATSAPNPTPNPRPTGDLEHLFRQKFSEAEVTPRADLWEQLDHELLVEQNNTYRRRLSVHRWVAAACLLFFLSLGSWALLRQWQAPTAGLTAHRVAGGPNAAANSQADLASANPNPDATTTNAATGTAPLLIDAASASPTDERLAAENATAPLPLEPGLSANEYGGVATYGQAVAGTRASGGASRRLVGTITDPGFADGPYAMSRPGLVAAPFDSRFPTTGSTSAMPGWNGIAPRFAGLRGGWLSSRPDTLKASLLAAPQPAIGALAAGQDQTQTPPAKRWRRLRLGGSYAASSYNPNIDFSPANGQALASADAVSSALRNYYQDDAETEYRRNLRAGLSQRVAFTAAYTLNKRLALVSGVEAGQQRATSATSYDFLDGQQVNPVATNSLSNTAFYSARNTAAPMYLRKTSYRYRTVAVPVEIRYGSQRTGASLYAKVGAAVGMLLSTKSELKEYSTATSANTTFALGSSTKTTRRYSPSSNDSPYRKVQASVRGGAGVRYQPANATWNLALGPTGEMGFVTLNTNPGSQSRPYSVGVEASVEFNSHKPAPTAP